MTDPIGAMRTLVILSTPGTASDGQGGVTPWPGTTYGTAYAEAQPLAGREYLLAQQIRAGTPWRLRLRYDAGITQAMRVTFGTRTLEIVSVTDPEDEHRWTVLTCWEIA